MRDISQDIKEAVEAALPDENVLEITYQVAIEDHDLGGGKILAGSCYPAPQEARREMLKFAMEGLE